MIPIPKELKETYLAVCEILDREGVLDELGHVSVRLPGGDRVLTFGKVSPAQGRDKDFIVLDLEGNRLQGTCEPANERFLHLGIYKARPDVQAIAHTHSPTVISLSAAGRVLRPVENLGAVAYGAECPVFTELGLVDNFPMAGRVAKTLGQGKSAVLLGHGNVVVAGDLEEVCVLALWAEKSARLLHSALCVGSPRYIPADQVDAVARQVIAGKAVSRVWRYHCWKSGQTCRPD
jgi:ribulose-5-phosphate 4-epimerase/fuculose-1-phosphate aldolase